jgi:hypothetical protein
MKNDSNKEEIKKIRRKSSLLIILSCGLLALTTTQAIKAPNFNGTCNTLPLEKRIVLRPASEERLNELGINFDGEKTWQYDGYLQLEPVCSPFYQDPNFSQPTDMESQFPTIFKNPLARINEAGDVAIRIGDDWAPLTYFHGFRGIESEGQQEVLKRAFNYAPMSGSTK